MYNIVMYYSYVYVWFNGKLGHQVTRESVYIVCTRGLAVSRTNICEFMNLLFGVLFWYYFTVSFHISIFFFVQLSNGNGKTIMIRSFENLQLKSILLRAETTVLLWKYLQKQIICTTIPSSP